MTTNREQELLKKIEKLEEDILYDCSIKISKNHALMYELYAELKGIQETKDEIIKKIDIIEECFNNKLDEYFDVEIRRQEAKSFIKNFIKELKEMIKK